MTAFSTLPIAALLLGSGILGLLGCRTGWTERIASGVILGAPALTLLAFLIRSTGCPYGPTIAWTVVGLAALVGLLGGWRGAERDTCSRVLAPIFLGTLTAVLVVLRALARATPEGDGVGHYAMKARFFHALGSPWTFLRDPRFAPLHQDYPPHVPFGMELGYLLDGGVQGLAALGSDLLALPATVVLVGVAASRRSVLGGLLAATACALVPSLHVFAASGYADVPLTALVTLVGVTLVRPRLDLRTLVPALGLLPWIKLEGTVLLALFGGVVILTAWRQGERPWFGAVATLALAAVWPLTVLAVGLRVDLTEPTADVDLLDRAAAAGNGFGRQLFGPRPFAFAGVAAVLGAVFSLSIPRMRRAAWVVLGALVAFPSLAVIRRTALQHFDGDVPERLILQVIPLGLFLAVTVLMSAEDSKVEVD